jgi:hypothetical protein
MSAYVLAQLTFTDIAAYRRYEANFPAVFMKSAARCSRARPGANKSGTHRSATTSSGVPAYAPFSSAERLIWRNEVFFDTVPLITAIREWHSFG